MENNDKNEEEKTSNKTIGVRLSAQERQWLEQECIAQTERSGKLITPTIFIKHCIHAAHAKRQSGGVSLTVALLLTQNLDVLREIERELRRVDPVKVEKIEPAPVTLPL